MYAHTIIQRYMYKFVQNRSVNSGAAGTIIDGNTLELEPRITIDNSRGGRVSHQVDDFGGYC